ncbi:MAG: uroporphyrinogen-III synthase [Pseudomonadota bacterium]
MKILVTRPQPAAQRTADVLRAGGYEPIVDPLLRIEPTNQIMPVGQFGGLVFTSAEAVCSFTDHKPVADWAGATVFCVGRTTLETAKDAGFGVVQSGDGTARQLAETIAMDPAASKLNFLYVCAETVSFDLAGDLERRGITCSTWPIYRAVVASGFHGSTLEAFEKGEVDAVLLYSARTAKAFSYCVQQAGISDLVQNVRIFALSRQVADALDPDNSSVVVISKEPTEVSLIEAISGAT